MTALRLMPLGPDGILYIKSCLEDSGVFASRVNGLINADGVASAPLPEGTSLNRALNFEGGKLSSPRSAKAWLADHLIALLQEGKKCRVIVEDLVVRPSDPGARDSGQKTFFHDSKVYYFLEGYEISPQSISSLMNCVCSFLLIGFIISPPVVIDKLPADGVVSDQFIDQLVQHTQEVFVSAYDQEGIVLWQRQAEKSK